MTNFPAQIDDDSTLPPVNDNITEVGDLAINALRDAVFAIEENIGVGAAGTTGSIAARLAVSFNPDGTPNPSLLASMGLTPGSVYDLHVNSAAAIKESKLDLDYSTQDLFDFITNNINQTNQALNWITLTGSKLEPHLAGDLYRHQLEDLDVSSSSGYFRNKFGNLRDNTNTYTALNDLNSELVGHQKLDGSVVSSGTMTSNSGLTFSANYAHPGSGIFLDVRNFTFIPQTANDVQKFAEFINSSNISIIGTRIQNFYNNGISRTARSSSLVPDETGFNSTVGQAIVPYTSVKTYLLEGSSTSPVDNIDSGDDLVEFFPTVSGNVFDSQFVQVSVGDILTVTYENIGGVPLVVSYIIKEKKYSVDGSGNKKFVVRINNTNLFGSSHLAVGRIDKPLFNVNKYGVLALAHANNTFGGLPSLIAGNPRGAVALGTKFDPDLIGPTNYKLYLQFFPDGNPTSSVVNLPGIDITGNAGTTTGRYTLENIIKSINNQFRAPGYNYRFIAFQYQGQLGIMAADSYNNASFSIVAGVLDSATGTYSQSLSNTSYPNNVIDLFNNRDPLGLGPGYANLASPPYAPTFATTELARTPTRILIPLKRNNYYVDGSESEKFVDGYLTTKDSFDNGYWNATITNKVIVPGVRLGVSYSVNLDLSNANLKVGKTITVQPNNSGSYVDFGRFIISDVQFVPACCGDPGTTTITVYDAIHGTAITPFASSPIGTAVKLYFDDGSISFNSENASDINTVSPFKRYFETYIDKNGHTFTHERARVNISGGTLNISSTPIVPIYGNALLNNINLFNISPKLRGYKFDNYSKINLLLNYDENSGIFDGYVCKFDGTNITNLGPISSGKKGEIIKIYDETTIDYLEIIFNLSDAISSFTAAQIDIQLYSSLSLDDEVMLLGSCQVNDSTKEISFLRDLRQFGNISEKQLSNSALDYINAGNRLLHQNGVIRGFDLISVSNNVLSLRGGTALVNGNFVNLNNDVVSVPLVQENYLSTIFTKINWLLCVNDKNEYEFVALTDFDSVSPATPNASQRIMTVFNPVNSTTYQVESRRFIDVISRKDLTILYKITTVVDNLGVLTTSLQPNNLHDARKFVFESDSFIDPVITSEKSQGNFYNFDSLATWLKYNSNYFNRINVKGSLTVSGSYSFNFFSTSGHIVKFNGNNVSSLTFLSGSSVTFENCHFNELPMTIQSGATVNFSNCVFDPMTIIGVSGSTLTFNNCNFQNITLNISGTANFNNSSFDRCTLNFNSGSTISPGSNSKVLNSTLNLSQTLTLGGFSFEKCNITVSGVAKGFVLSSNVKFINSTFIYDFDPTSPPDGIYSTSNFVNSSAGLMYVNVSNQENIEIEKCVFTSSLDNRYPFISFEYNSATSQAQNIIIRDNHFIDSNSSEMVRAAVSFINNVVSGTSSLQGPKLTFAKISGNICNKNQMIAISSKRDIDDLVKNAISTINCEISNNICGTIAILNRFETISSSENTSLIKDKVNGLNIFNNTCKLISTLDGYGARFSTTSDITVPTGNVLISQNHCSWIVLNPVGSSSVEDKLTTAIISGNFLNAYNFVFQTQFGTGGVSTAIDILPGSSNPGNIVIADNVIDFGASVASDGTTEVVYTYDLGISSVNIRSSISDNLIKGLTSSGATSGILIAGSDSVITNNQIIRGTSTIGQYIQSVSGNSIITDNVFDFPTIDGTSEQTITITSGTPTAERNKNQTVFTYIPLQSFNSFILNTGTSSSAVLNERYTITGTDNSTATIKAINSSGNNLLFQIYFNLNNLLPYNTTVVRVRLGINIPSSPALNNSPYNAGNNISLFYENNDGYAFMDVRTTRANSPTYQVFTSYAPISDTTRDNLINSTQYLTLVPTSTNGFLTTNRSLMARISGFLEFDAGGGELYFSPIEVKYRW